MIYNAKEHQLKLENIQMTYITFGKGTKPLVMIQGLSTRSIKGAVVSLAYMGERESIYRISGSVEMDEAFFGGKAAGKRGRGSENKTEVAVALQLDNEGHPQFLKMQVIPNAKGSTLLAFAKNNVTGGSTIHSDAFRSYNALFGDYCCDMQKYNPKSSDGRAEMAPCNDFEHQGKY